MLAALSGGIKRHTQEVERAGIGRDEEPEREKIADAEVGKSTPGKE